MAGSGTAHLRPPDEALLRVEHMVVDFPAGPGRHVSAVADVSLDVASGETLGLVGESGCGKSTTARAVMQLPKPTAGTVVFDGHELTALDGEKLRVLRPQLQIVFQDPISSLNPRRRVGDIVRAPLKIWGRGSEAEREARVDEVLEAVGLDADVARDKRPHEFSGGVVLVHPRPQSRAPGRGGRAAARGPAVAAGAAERLPLPHALPPGAGPVRGRGTAGARGRRRAVRGMPFPVGGRRGTAGAGRGGRGPLVADREPSWRHPPRPVAAWSPSAAGPRSSRPPPRCSAHATRRPCGSTRWRWPRVSPARSSTPTSATGTACSPPSTSTA